MIPKIELWEDLPKKPVILRTYFKKEFDCPPDDDDRHFVTPPKRKHPTVHNTPTNPLLLLCN